MFWLIVGAVVVVGFALAWWSSGRTKPELRRHGAPAENGISKGEVESMRNEVDRVRKGFGTAG